MVYLLFLLIFIEGYIVLATELLAVRLTLPMVGAGTDTVAVIIAGVLMPLAFGYYAGGHYRAHRQDKKRRSIRRKLLWNMIVAGLILSFGLSMGIVEEFFALLEKSAIHDRIVQITLYTAIFIVYPVFLLGQTLPLTSHFFSKKTLAQMTGRMLAFSTFGSFLGSVFTTLVLMTFIGVHYTVVFNLTLLAVMIWALSKKGQLLVRSLATAIFALAFLFNNGLITRFQGVVSNNSYSTVKMAAFISTDPQGRVTPQGRVLVLNNSYSAGYSDTEGPMFAPVQYINSNYIKPLLDKAAPVKEILVLGGGGFTVGLHDRKNEYTYVDINPDIKRVSEDYLLRQKLGANKHFVAEDARGFIRQNKKKFDLIVLDAHAAVKSTPEYLLTKEYFLGVRNALKNNGAVVMNFILCPNFEDVFSVRLDNTLRSVFPQMNRSVVVFGDYNAWDGYQDKAGDCTINVVYSATFRPEMMEDREIYSDNMNTIFLDKGRRH